MENAKNANVKEKEQRVEKPRSERLREKIFTVVIIFASVCSIIFVFGIILSLFFEGYQVFFDVPFFDFVFGGDWNPTSADPDFGILPLIIGSLYVTLITIIIAVPLGIGTALYVAEFASPGVREFLKPFIELLASIPSVIYGLFGMAFLGPVFADWFGLQTGQNAFTAAVILGIMCVPIIASISEDAFNAVPKNLREASLALGADKWETTVKVVLPAAKSGVISSIILGVGRAIGETMVVLMVAGNARKIPDHLFDIFSQVRPMTSTIAAEMGETPRDTTHYYALIAIAMVLFVITFILNIITEEVRKKSKEIRFK